MTALDPLMGRSCCVSDPSRNSIFAVNQASPVQYGNCNTLVMTESSVTAVASQ